MAETFDPNTEIPFKLTAQEINEIISALSQPRFALIQKLTLQASQFQATQQAAAVPAKSNGGKEVR